MHTHTHTHTHTPHTHTHTHTHIHTHTHTHTHTHEFPHNFQLLSQSVTTITMALFVHLLSAQTLFRLLNVALGYVQLGYYPQPIGKLS